MSRRHAIDLAIEARTRQERASLLSVGPLPEGVKSLLRIVAEGEWRDHETEHAYRRHSPEEIRAASASFLAAVLFSARSDPYRVLGLAPEARPEDVRENKRLLLKWLHPDRNPAPQEREYLGRVIEAAEAIETGRATAAPGSRGGARPPTIVVPPRAKPTRKPREPRRRQAAARALEGSARALRFAILVAVAAVVVLAAWKFVMHEPIGATLARYARLVPGLATW